MVTTRKVVGWLLLAFVLFYVITAPDESADLVRKIVDGLGSAADSFSEFIQSVV